MIEQAGLPDGSFVVDPRHRSLAQSYALQQMADVLLHPCAGRLAGKVLLPSREEYDK